MATASLLWFPSCKRYSTRGAFAYYTCPGHDPVIAADCAACEHGQQPKPRRVPAPTPVPAAPVEPPAPRQQRRPKHPPVDGKPVANWGFWEEPFSPALTNLGRAKQLIAEGHKYLAVERMLNGPTRTLGRRLKRDAEKAAKHTP